LKNKLIGNYLKKYNMTLTRINGKFVLLQFKGQEEAIKNLHPESIKWIAEMIEKDFSWGGFFIMDENKQKEWGGSWDTIERQQRTLKNIPDVFIHQFYMSGATSLLDLSKEYYKANPNSEGINELHEMMVALENVIKKENEKVKVK